MFHPPSFLQSHSTCSLYYDIFVNFNRFKVRLAFNGTLHQDVWRNISIETVHCEFAFHTSVPAPARSCAFVL